MARSGFGRLLGTAKRLRELGSAAAESGEALAAAAPAR